MTALRFSVPVAAAALLALAACSSNEQTSQDMSSLRSQVHQAQQTASSAEAEARSANERAAAAEAKADQANNKAEQMYNRSLRK